ncbi:DNA mismatch repair protein MutL [Neolecta irregularis DAH-3]|uniref:DNA mismatch repair protein MutL n=1 Tax=Neolecta irregularis (strain DAH-3) TaxID=1198029 RepID=A0A1U7LUK9_NEOID|nr:DNA mismatch repair protein MutL [Neolecta irregularis DAH-3]|eukprot:OLL26360.1 DNA mismatch repair protein MutL [Neolecta irregularis DAH-3]
MVNLKYRSLTINDDGHGILPDEMCLLGTRFATSKCQTLEDLDSLNTFGFRVEALANIFAVSNCVITSRHKDYNATHSTHIISGIRKQSLKNYTMQKAGTTVTVSDLFFNIPARQKTRPENTMRSIIGVIVETALAKLGVGITLRDNNGVLALSIKPEMKEMDILGCIYDHINECSTLKIQEGSIKIIASISNLLVDTKRHQYIYLNQRLLKPMLFHISISNLTQRALELNEDGYKRQRHLLYVIKIVCPVSAYDICLDPSKSSIVSEVVPEIQSLLNSIITKHLNNIGFNSPERSRKIVDAQHGRPNTFNAPAKFGKIKAAKLDTHELQGRETICSFMKTEERNFHARNRDRKEYINEKPSIPSDLSRDTGDNISRQNRKENWAENILQARRQLILYF